MMFPFGPPEPERGGYETLFSLNRPSQKNNDLTYSTG